MGKEKIHFGTDGIRGKAHEHPFTDKALFYLGRAIALWSKQKYGGIAPRLLLGHDTRASCQRIKHALTKGLVSHQVLVTDAGEIPTPAVLQLMRQDRMFDYGIIISASHNPYDDNGIKLFDALQGKLDHHDEAFIEYHFNEYMRIISPADEEMLEYNFSNERFNEIDNPPAWEIATWHGAWQKYADRIASFFPNMLLQGLTVVLDCAHGATYEVAPLAFSRLGAHVIPLHVSPTGTNINDQCGALHPENLIAAVRNHRADIGFAFDGDGDRVLAVTQQGIVKDGDDLLCLLLQHPAYQQVSTVVGTVMTNYGFEQHLTQMQKKLLRVKVGDKYIVHALDRHNLLVGGETSGHVILQDYLPTGDGIFVALRTLETILLTKNWECKTFEKYPQVMVNVAVSYKKDLQEQPYAQVIESYKNLLQSGRLIVRYSGTEALLRVMVEDRDQSIAARVAYELAERLARILNEAPA